MQVIDNELSVVKSLINDNIQELLPNNYLKSFILDGSKFIRSRLAILYLKSQNLEINDNIYKILYTGELIHSSSLLHDDVIDNAIVRRRKTCISKEFSPKISILVGDYLLTYAMETLLDLDNKAVWETFKDCVKKMSETEVKQFLLRNKNTSEDEYLKICEGKTATLFSAILKSCFLMFSKDYKEAIEFARIFGIYFQIKNDLEKKSANEDKINGISTAEEIFGIEKTNILLDNYRKEMENFINNFPDSIYQKSLKDLIYSI